MKLNTILNLTYWLLGGLKIFLPPTEEEYENIREVFEFEFHCSRFFMVLVCLFVDVLVG